MSGAEARVLSDVRSSMGARPSNTNEELSCRDIESVDDLAELLIGSPSLRRKLIETEGLSGVEPSDDTSAVVERLLARHGTELAIRKILDTPHGADVVSALSHVLWEGRDGVYALVEPGTDAGSLREAVLCLTTLVTAHLEKGGKGVDSVASTTPLLKAVKQDKTLEPPKADERAAPNAFALVDLVSKSSPEDAFVALGDDFLVLPKQAFKVLTVSWPSWLELLGDDDYIEKSVRLTPGLPPGAHDIILAQLRRRVPIRAVKEVDGPHLFDVARCLSEMGEEEARRAARRVHDVFFRERFTSLESFLMACLAALLAGRETI